jgi:uncharacterized protein (UPF0276 family)
MALTAIEAPGLPAMGIGWRQPHYAGLLQAGPALDFIEVHSENFFAPGGAARAVLRQGRERYPVSLHGVGLSLGSACGVDDWHLAQLARLVQETDPVRVSDHASFARAPLAGVKGPVHASDLLPVPFTREALAVMGANVQRVQERLRRPIAVENLSAYLNWADADMLETEFLATLAQRTGCSLLVDVNNLYVNAQNAQLRGEVDSAPGGDPGAALASCRDWINRIAASPVAELHLAGHVHLGDIVIDDHGSRVCPEVWALYRHALERLGPVPTLIEWDTDVPPLAVLLDEVERARDIARGLEFSALRRLPAHCVTHQPSAEATRQLSAEARP